MQENTEHINHIFLILFGVVLVIIITVVFLFITFNNRKNKLLQEQLQTQLNHQKRQYELQLNALRAQMNPHFVHNSLNAIQYYIQLNEVEKSEDFLAKFSKLMRQFFEFSRKSSISLDNEIKLLTNYLDIEKLRFEDKFDFHLNIDKNLDTEEKFIPPMILQPILENAVNHGIFHMQEKGEIAINFIHLSEQKFKVEIIDNGIGVNASKALSKEKKEQFTEHSGFILEERINLLKESSHWHVDFKMQDRSEIENTSGTKVTLVFNEGKNGNDYEY